MLTLEEKLIHEINCGNKKKALQTYKKLRSYFKFHDLGNGCYLQSVKNHIICINLILYRNFCNNTTCKNSMHIRRNEFINEIEKQTSIENVLKLGEKVITFYIDTITRTCVCVENPIIKEALNYIHNHIDEHLTLEKVANSINISKNYLSNLFPKSVGCNLSNYINKVRIEKSKIILKNSNYNLIDVAIECGFNSQSYFCYIFKKVTGMTPSQYQKLASKDSIS